MSINFDLAKVNLENLCDAIKNARFDTVEEAASAFDVLAEHAADCLEELEALGDTVDSASYSIKEAVESLNEIV